MCEKEKNYGTPCDPDAAFSGVGAGENSKNGKNSDRCWESLVEIVKMVKIMKMLNADEWRVGLVLVVKGSCSKLG